eukprot:8324655-Alexandrium_andersonii.AAC.1
MATGGGSRMVGPRCRGRTGSRWIRNRDRPGSRRAVVRTGPGQAQLHMAATRARACALLRGWG